MEKPIVDITSKAGEAKFFLDGVLSTVEADVSALGRCLVNDEYRLKLAPMSNVLIHYIVEGSGELIMQDVSYELTQGCFAVVPKNKLHYLQTTKGSGRELDGISTGHLLSDGLLQFGDDGNEPRLTTICATINANYWHSLGFFDAIEFPLLYQPSDIPELSNLLVLLTNEVKTPQVGTRAITAAMLKQSLVYLLRTELKRPEGSAWIAGLKYPQVGRAISAILQSPTDSLSLEQLAEIAGMSRSVLSRKFLEALGVSPVEFQTLVKLRRAAIMLTHSDIPISMVAMTVGYSSRSHFSRTFKKSVGVDPSEFRRNGKGAAYATQFLGYFRDLFH